MNKVNIEIFYYKDIQKKTTPKYLQIEYHKLVLEILLISFKLLPFVNQMHLDSVFDEKQHEEQ
jgi:hypothetical protein